MRPSWLNQSGQRRFFSTKRRTKLKFKLKNCWGCQKLKENYSQCCLYWIWIKIYKLLITIKRAQIFWYCTYVFTNTFLQYFYGSISPRYVKVPIYSLWRLLPILFSIACPQELLLSNFSSSLYQRSSESCTYQEQTTILILSGGTPLNMILKNSVILVAYTEGVGRLS